MMKKEKYQLSFVKKKTKTKQNKHTHTLYLQPSTNSAVDVLMKFLRRNIKDINSSLLKTITTIKFVQTTKVK